MRLIHFLTPKPLHKNPQTPFYVLSNTPGNLAFYPPSPFGEGRGEALFPHSVLSNTTGYLAYYSPLPSERAGERLLFPHSVLSNTTGYLAFYPPLLSERDGERLYETLLQAVRCYCSQINSLSLKIAFVTIKESIGYKEGCKRCPFALQNMPFYTSKDALLHCKRASFTTQKGVDGKRKGKEIDKRRAELRKEKRPPQAPLYLCSERKRVEILFKLD